MAAVSVAGFVFRRGARLHRLFLSVLVSLSAARLMLSAGGRQNPMQTQKQTQRNGKWDTETLRGWDRGSWGSAADGALYLELMNLPGWRLIAPQMALVSDWFNATIWPDSSNIQHWFSSFFFGNGIKGWGWFRHLSASGFRMGFRMEEFWFNSSLIKEWSVVRLATRNQIKHSGPSLIAIPAEFNSTEFNFENRRILINVNWKRAAVWRGSIINWLPAEDHRRLINRRSNAKNPEENPAGSPTPRHETEQTISQIITATLIELNETDEVINNYWWSSVTLIPFPPLPRKDLAVGRWKLLGGLIWIIAWFGFYWPFIIWILMFGYFNAFSYFYGARSH